MKRGILTCDATLGVDCLEAQAMLPISVETPSWIDDAAEMLSQPRFKEHAA